ncbi:MAG: hypothetical protein WCD66_05790 [Rhodanobacteraceae bacterium]
MRTTLIVLGAIALAFGIWVLVAGGSYSSNDTVLKVGSAELTAKTDKTIPQWAGIGGVVVGGILVIGGFVSGRKR